MLNRKVVAGGNGEGNRVDQLNWATDVMIDKKTGSIIIYGEGNRPVIRWSRQKVTASQIIISGIDCYNLTMDNNGAIVAGGNKERTNLNQLSNLGYIFVDEDHSAYVWWTRLGE